MSSDKPITPDTKALREKLEAATKATWRVSSTGYSIKSDDPDVPIVAAPQGGASVTEKQFVAWLENATAIVALHNAAPALLDELDRLRAEDEEARATLVRILEDAEKGIKPAVCAWCGEVTDGSLDAKREHQRICRESPIVRELTEERMLRERLAKLLEGVAAALKGPPGELEMHGWHDLPDRAQAVTSALRKALPFVERAAQPEPIYGFFHGGDPRDFDPDPESSTDEERAAHKAACEKWNAGNGEPEPSCCTVEGNVIVTRAPFGLGVNIVRDREAEEALKAARAALATAASGEGE